jgi:hypothetical protein
MAKLVLKITPKPARTGKPAITHHNVAEGIHIRVLGVDWQKTKELVINDILNQFTDHIKDSAVKEGIQKKELAGLPNDYVGKHELYVFVGDDKATKIDLTVDPEPVFDIKKECPLFANTKGMKADKEFLGGGKDDPHVHVYSGGFHLKLGSHRYNIVQSDTLYESAIKDAHSALKSHALKDTLAPYVAAALKKFKYID